MSQQTRLFLYFVAALIITYLLSSIGIFKMYAHLFSEKHLHRQNFFFRLGFMAVFSLANYGYFVPRFYMQKRYTPYFAIVMGCLVLMMLLPEFIIEQPKFGRPDLVQSKLFIPPDFPVPVPMFETVNLILLFFIVIYTSMVKHTQQNLPQLDYENGDLEANLNKQEEVITNNTLEQALTVTVNYSLMRIVFDEILFIKSMDNYLHFHLKAKKPILVRMTLKDVLEKLPNDNFLRVHKSFIVAKTAINSIRNKTILIGEQEIPIGRAYEEMVFKIMGK